MKVKQPTAWTGWPAAIDKWTAIDRNAQTHADTDRFKHRKNRQTDKWKSHYKRVPANKW